jgi:hypothetical protein
MNSPLDVKENDENALDFALHLFRLFLSALNRACHSNSRVRFMLSSPNACLITVKVSVALFPRFAQNLMLFLCRIHREIVSGQIHESK